MVLIGQSEPNSVHCESNYTELTRPPSWTVRPGGLSGEVISRCAALAGIVDSGGGVIGGSRALQIRSAT